MKDRILITGASGFLGKCLVEELEKTNNQIFCMSVQLKKNSNWFKVNLLEQDCLKSIIIKIKPNIIIHLAAHVNLSRDWATAQKNIDINLKGTLNLLDSFKKHQIKKFIFASTEEVYGDGSLPFKENQRPRPPSIYSITKLAGEDLCKIYAKNLYFPLIIFRLASFYGPNNPTHRFFPQIISKILTNQEVPLTSKNKKRDYLYIDDAIKAFLLAVNKKILGQQILNIGGGKNYSLNEVTRIIMKLTNSKSKLLWNKIPERSLEANDWLMDISLARKLLNWYPVISLEKGLKETIKSFKQP